MDIACNHGGVCIHLRKSGIINDIKFIHNHGTNPDKLQQLESGMNFIRYSGASDVYYFCNYVSDSKILQAIYRLLIWLRWLKSYAGYQVRKYFTVSKAKR